MKIDKKEKSLAKKIVNISRKNGELNREILAKFISLLTSSKTLKARKILSRIEKDLSKAEKQSTLVVESPFGIDPKQQEKILAFFEKQSGKKLTLKYFQKSDLISGIKIKLGDTILENNVFSKLASLKETMVHE
jgi:F0F1-type ATP synthase delta subunit